MATYRNLVIDGTVSIEAVTDAPLHSINLTWSTVILLMGPTGSGKSSFIEALATNRPEGPLGISKDQLDSVTQNVEMYKVINASNAFGNRIYVVDTPGFNDPRISELQVLHAVRYLRDRCTAVLQPIRIIYFHPITDIRMPGSKKKCIDIMQSFWGAPNARTAILVTTLWDRLRPELREKAEMRLESIGKQHWGDWKEKGSKILKFENNYESAMAVLNRTLASFGSIKIDALQDNSLIPSEGPAVQALRDRLESLHQQIQSIDSDLRDPDTHRPEYLELKTFLMARREEIKEHIGAFGMELASALPYYKGSIEEPDLPSVPSTPRTPVMTIEPAPNPALPNSDVLGNELKDGGEEEEALSTPLKILTQDVHVVPSNTISIPRTHRLRPINKFKTVLGRLRNWVKRL